MICLKSCMSAKDGLSSAAGTPEDLAAVIGTIFFISGWITLMQTIAGDRLPIVQVSHAAPLCRELSQLALEVIQSTRPLHESPCCSGAP